MIKKITLVIICILALSIPTFALEDINVQQGSVLSLNDCISIALNHNPAIKNARYNYGISKSNVGVARSEFFRQLVLEQDILITQQVLAK